MPAALLWIIKNPVTTALIAAVVALGIYAGFLQMSRFGIERDLSDTKLANATLVTQKAALQKSVDSLTTEVNLVKQAEAVLSDTLSKVTQQKVDDAAIQRDIDAAPKSDDAPIAPVLRRSLDAIH